MVSFRVHSHNMQLPFGTQIPRCLLLHSRFKFTRFNISKAEIDSRIQDRGFPGGAVVKNQPADAGDKGSIPGPGRSHMPWSN